MELNKQQSNFEQLLDSIYQTHCVLQENTQRIINQNLTLHNWLVGYYIVEFEQNGADRAKYGERLIDEMAKILKQKDVKGFSPMALRSCRTFYKTYPQIQQTVTNELDNEPFISAELLLSRLSYSHFIELTRVEESLERLFYEVEAIKNNWRVHSCRCRANDSISELLRSRRNDRRRQSSNRYYPMC